MNKKQYILLYAITAGAFVASAQGLHTEVTVDRTVQPVLNEAERPVGLTPSILSESVEPKHLTSAEYTSASMLTPDISILPASPWPDEVTKCQYRGYAAVGYLPLYNLGASAGYRILDKKNYGLGVWAEYNGDAYHGDFPNYKSALFNNHHFTLGGNGFIHFGSKSLLTASLRGTLASIRVPYYYTNNGDQHWRSYNQGANDMEGAVKLNSGCGDVAYSIGGKVGYFSMGQDQPTQFMTNNQQLKQAYGIGDLSVGLTDGSSVPWIGFDGSLEILRSSNLMAERGYFERWFLTMNLAQGSFRPYMRFDGDGFEAKVGLNITGSVNYQSSTDYIGKKMRVFPDINVTWRQGSILAIYASLTGDEYINHMSDLFSKNPYLEPYQAYGRTRMPAVAKGGMNLGPFDGMSLSIYGGYALGRDLLLPLITIQRSGHMVSNYYTSKANSWYLGAKVGYAYQDLFDFTFGISTGGSDNTSASWYEWSDAAKVVADVDIKINPIDRLTIDLGYHLRYDRKARIIIYPADNTSNTKYSGTPNLGTVNDVNIAARYKVSDALTAFIDINNLLNQHYILVSAMPAIGINGLIGAAYKF